MNDMTLTQAIVTLGLALIASIAPTMVAYAALQQGKKNEQQQVVAAVKQAENTAITTDTARITIDTSDKTDELVKRVDEVHVLTNSNLTAVKAALEMAEQKIKSMEDVIGKLVDAREKDDTPNAFSKSLTGAVADALAAPPKTPTPKSVAEQLMAAQPREPRGDT